MTCARYGVVLVALEVLLPFAGVVVVAAGAVVFAGFAVVLEGVVVVFDGALVVPLGCVGVVVEAGVTGAAASPGFGKGLDVMPAINSLRPSSEPLRYL